MLPASASTLAALVTTVIDALRRVEVHIFDRKIEPETAARQSALDRINARPDCRALLISKRSLENDPHTVVIVNAGGGMIQVHDDSNIAIKVAQDWYHRQPQGLTWDELPPRARRRVSANSKRWLPMFKDDL